MPFRYTIRECTTAMLTAMLTMLTALLALNPCIAQKPTPETDPPQAAFHRSTASRAASFPTTSPGFDIFIPLDTTQAFTFIEMHEVLRGGRLPVRLGQTRRELGETWTRMYAEGSTIPAEGWYRNDADGLHVLRDSADKWLVDRLLLPTRVTPGEQLPEGSVTDTGSMMTGDIIRRTVTVDYGERGRWTWADSVGLVHILRGSSEYRLLETEGFRSPLLDRPPPEFHPPFDTGDVLVFEMDDARRFIVSTWYSAPETWFTVPFKGFYYISTNHERLGRRIAIDEDGCVRDGSCQLYPAYVPRGPEVLLNNAVWSVTRVMDTTVFDTGTRAFLLERGGIRRIITERFGEIEARMPGGEQWFRLSSAIINDTGYNRDTRRRIWLPLCVGNTWQYHHVKKQWWPVDEYVSMTVTRDSMFAGHIWYRIEGSGPFSGWFRCDSSGVYRWNSESETRIIAGDASLGSITRYPLIVGDTSRVSFMGRERDQIVEASRGGPDYGRWVHWADGFGLFRDYEWGFVSRDDNYDLVYARVCGETWGTPVGVEATEQLPLSPSIRDVYPHPIGNTATVSFSLSEARPVRVAILDPLGRHRAIVIDRVFSPGLHTESLEMHSLPPGAYILILSTPEYTSSRTILHR